MQRYSIKNGLLAPDKDGELVKYKQIEIQLNLMKSGARQIIELNRQIFELQEQLREAKLRNK
jgi:hypothetical protein